MPPYFCKMNVQDELVAVIKKFKEYTNNGNRILQAQYQQQVDPLSARRWGYIAKTGNIATTDGNLFYNFHGIGVHLEFPDNRVIDFDYEMTTAEDGNSIFLPSNFSLYSLHQFIDSDGTSISALKDKTTCEIALKALVRRKELIPLTYPDMVAPSRFYFI